MIWSGAPDGLSRRSHTHNRVKRPHISSSPSQRPGGPAKIPQNPLNARAAIQSNRTKISGPPPPPRGRRPHPTAPALPEVRVPPSSLSLNYHAALNRPGAERGGGSPAAYGGAGRGPGNKARVGGATRGSERSTCAPGTAVSGEVGANGRHSSRRRWPARRPQRLRDLLALRPPAQDESAPRRRPHHPRPEHLQRLRPRPGRRPVHPHRRARQSRNPEPGGPSRASAPINPPSPCDGIGNWPAPQLQPYLRPYGHRLPLATSRAC